MKSICVPSSSQIRHGTHGKDQSYTPPIRLAFANGTLPTLYKSCYAHTRPHTVTKHALQAGSARPTGMHVDPTCSNTNGCQQLLPRRPNLPGISTTNSTLRDQHGAVKPNQDCDGSCIAGQVQNGWIMSANSSHSPVRLQSLSRLLV